MLSMVDTFEKFKANTLSEKDFMMGIITSIGAGLYPYMLYLGNAGRKTEEKLIKEHRDDVFKVRDAFDKGEISRVDMHHQFSKTYSLLNVQLLMIKADELKRWEYSFLDSYMNEFCRFIWLIEPPKITDTPLD